MYLLLRQIAVFHQNRDIGCSRIMAAVMGWRPVDALGVGPMNTTTAYCTN